MTILFPLVLSLPAYYVLNKTKVFTGMNVLEKFVLVLASSISVINILLAYFGVLMPTGIKEFAIFIFLLSLVFLLLSSKSLLRDVRSVYKLISQNRVYKTLFILLFVLIAKVTVFYIIRPVVDADIISQYLPFARSIAINNHVPALDTFTLGPMTVPPIGGPMLFSFYYLVTGSLQSEGFRLLTYPFFMGLVALAYLISKKLFRNTWYALLTAIVFLSFPMIDYLLLEWALYPDIISAFLELTIVYFLLFKKQNVQEGKNLTLYIILGISAAEILLLKTQGLLFYTLLVILILIRGKISKYRTYILGCLLAVVVLLFPATNLFGLNYLRTGSINTLSYIFLVLPVTIILAAGYKVRKSPVEIKPISMAIIGIVATLGALWLVRNYLLFENIFSAYGIGMYKDMSINYEVFMKGVDTSAKIVGLKTLRNIALLALPVFGSFYLIPKAIGVIISIFNKSWNDVVLIVALWYALVVVYSGLPNERYLLGTFPFLSALIVLGIKYIADKLGVKMSASRKKVFSLVIVTLFAVFSLSQSIILSWGFGTSLFSPSELRKIAFTSSADASKLIELPKESLTSVARLLNIRLGNFSNADAVPLIILSISISAAILAFAFIAVKSTFINKLKKYLIFTPILIIIPYLVYILQMSGGNLRSYPNSVEQKLYSYWGEANTIVPYFKDNPDASSIILVVGPQTGLSYKTFMKAYNIEFGYGFVGISSIVKENNLENIYRYFKEKDIWYVLVYEGSDNEVYLNNFENKTTMYNFIKNEKYFTTEIFPDENNLWRLYKLRDKI